jgi:mannonate dehydratase
MQHCTYWPAATGDALAATENRRTGRHRPHTDAFRCTPFCLDRGHELLDEARRNMRPGYSRIGRMRCLAELGGVMTAVIPITSLWL